MSHRTVLRVVWPDDADVAVVTYRGASAPPEVGQRLEVIMSDREIVVGTVVTVATPDSGGWQAVVEP